jgi:hypothetical protein
VEGPGGPFPQILDPDQLLSKYSPFQIYTSLGWWAIVRIIPPQICIANATTAADKYVQQGKYGQAIITILEKYQ